MSESVRNQFVKEASSATDETITFPWRAAYIEILNDHSGDITFKLRSSDTYMTMKTRETIMIPAQSRQIVINAAGNYRVRAWA